MSCIALFSLRAGPHLTNQVSHFAQSIAQGDREKSRQELAAKEKAMLEDMALTAVDRRADFGTNRNRTFSRSSSPPTAYPSNWCPFSPVSFWGEGSPTKDYRKEGRLVLTSLLQNLDSEFPYVARGPSSM